ncbi:hypothetical protein GJ496_003708, partial [Pomphorhynchus laevis]
IATISSLNSYTSQFLCEETTEHPEVEFPDNETRNRKIARSEEVYELYQVIDMDRYEKEESGPTLINRDPSQEINENELMQTMSQTEIPMDILLQDDSNKISRFERVTVDPSQFTTLRSRIFAHFWDLGFWITDGEKFGGDFLLYEQDPLECHAFALCFCCGADEPVGRWLIALGRLVRSVNKQLFLCFTGKDGKLNIQSIRSWSSKEEFKKQTND